MNLLDNTISDDELLLLTKHWKLDEFKTRLSEILLPDELTVLISLIVALKEDGLAFDVTSNQLTLLGTGGWKNKEYVRQRTKLSAKVIFQTGFFKRLISSPLIEVRIQEHWGYDEYQYRANIHNAIVQSMFAAVLRERCYAT